MPLGVPKPPAAPVPPPSAPGFSLEDSLAAAAVAALGGPKSSQGLPHLHSTPNVGRAPQVRDRSGPRGSANPLGASPTLASLPLPPSLRPAPGSAAMNDKTHDISADDDLSPEQDEALSLVVGPKKKRHKVTDSRITPRAMNRALAGADGALTASNPALSSLSPRGANPAVAQAAAAAIFPGINPALAAAAAAAAAASGNGLPTSVAIPNPSLLAARSGH